jgi:Radical SAM N-terminal
MITGQIN